MEFTKAGETKELEISRMTDGDSCTYKIKASTCSPTFKISDKSTVDDSQIEMTFVEFDSFKIEISEQAGTGSDKSPEIGAPKRNQLFKDSDKHHDAEHGDDNSEQILPPRLKENGDMTEGIPLSFLAETD